MECWAVEIIMFIFKYTRKIHLPGHVRKRWKDKDETDRWAFCTIVQGYLKIDKITDYATPPLVVGLEL